MAFRARNVFVTFEKRAPEANRRENCANRHIRAVYTRVNKPRLTLAAAYLSRERNYLYEYKLRGQDKPRLEKAVNVDFVPFIRGVRGLRKPRPELAAAYFLSYKRPYSLKI